MTSHPLRRKQPFKDYCLVLQVHPEADGAMIDAAYWHLAKRYNEAALRDPSARKKLEELNEAYNVLGSPDRREAYMQERVAVLGAGALPVPPTPPAEKPPLTVMARQYLRPRVEEEEGPQRQRRWIGILSSVVAILVVLALSIAAFLAGAPPSTVASVFAVGLLIAAVPLTPGLLHVLRFSPRVRLPRPAPRHGALRSPDEGAAITPIDASRLKSSTQSRIEQLRPKALRDAAPPAASPSSDDRRD